MGTKFSEGKDYKVIALCFTRFKGQEQERLLNGMYKECKAHKVKLVTFTCVSDLYEGNVNDLGEAQIYAAFDVSRFDAVVIMSETFKNSDVPNRIASQCNENNVPVISVDRVVEGCHNITFGYGRSFEQIVKHIIEDHQVKRVNFLAGYKGNAFSEERVNCCRRVMEENGLKLEDDMIMYGDFWTLPTRNAVENLIKSGKTMPEAIICANDVMAIECMRVLKEHNYRVPEDVIVTGFDGIDLERCYSPRLTTAAYSDEDLIKAIYSFIDGDCQDEQVEIVYNMRKGGSCGCEPTSTVDVEETLYQEKMVSDAKDSYLEYLYHMITKLSNYPELQYVFKQLPEFLYATKIQKMWINFNKDVINSERNISRAYHGAEIGKEKYTDEMNSLYYDGKEFDEIVREYKHADLLPDIEKMIDENDHIMFIPFHLSGITIGYIATVFNMDEYIPGYYQTFSLDFAHIVEMYVNRAETERLYVTDSLTRIYNRHGFYKNIGGIMKKSRKEQIPFTLISIDMDGLKKINDTYGHAEGDYALKKIGEVMRNSTTDDDICARFGGDEFVIAYSCKDGDTRANTIIDTIYRNLDEFNSISDKPYHVLASIGVYSSVCENSEQLDEFIKIADNLMYENKMKHKKADAMIAVSNIQELLQED